MIHHHLRQSTYIPELIIIGDRDRDKGVVVQLNDPSETVTIGAIYAMDVFVPITVLSGTLRVDKVYTKLYGGDAIDVFGGRIVCKQAFSRSNRPTRPYGEYHQDWFQSDGLTNFKKDPRVRLERSVIHSIDVKLSGANAQGISITGKNDTCGFILGDTQFDLSLDGYPHAVNAFQMRNSLIGCENARTNGDVYIKNRNNFNHHATENVKCWLPINKYSDKGVIALPA